MQKRAMTKIAFPGRWDISSAGHVSAGEDVKESGRREMQEELGITEPLDMEFLYTRTCIGSINGGTYKDHEFEHVFAVYVDDELMKRLKFTLQETEVMDVKWMPMRDVQAAWTRKDEDFVTVGDPSLFDDLFAFVQKHKQQSQH